ncbi:minor capsid protein [Anaerococcus sp. Marseille-P3915]|uniref:minor capsid protein n=1 Tax=Anaerococcus sp. Marseille-P3915 TaxID=2057799 RepID=UPI000D0B2B2F|nr:minor capsid protein [Anaerococcus sp. Marseille-P3915]
MINFSKFDFDQVKALKKRDLETGGEVQKFIDSECIRRMDPYTPKDHGDLIGAATSQTSIGSGRIVQQMPYAKRWYYEPAKFQESPRRGNRWFERMKSNHKDSILRGAASIAGAKAK